MYEHRYFREEAQTDQMIAKELWVRPSTPILTMEDANVAAAYQAALAQVTTAARNNQAEVDQRVADAEKLKQRLEMVLERTTGQTLGADPSDWWKFWIDFNELFVPSERAIDQQSSRMYSTYFVPTPVLFLTQPAGGGGKGGKSGSGAGGGPWDGMKVYGFGQMTEPQATGRLPGFTYRQVPYNPGWIYDSLAPAASAQTMQLPGMMWLRPTSCFGAGTLVTTLAGPMPIEQIQIGDRVLAQDPETGELAYKLVLTTTVRPASSMLNLSVRRSNPQGAPDGDLDPNAGETFLTTKGHPFWVDGQGWQMAKNLEPGTRLHAACGSVEVTDLEPADGVEAYNLVVDEFHTYFVGKNHLLVHDNSFARPLLNSVPGLPPETAVTGR